MKTVIILRGVSGSGKSTFADYLSKLSSDTIVCTADDYMMVNGEYKFDPKKLGFAHLSCQHKFIEALKNNVNLVIVANTNTAEKDVRVYLDEAKTFGYQVFSLVIENRHGNTDVHSVPSETKIKQANTIKSNIKLL